MPEKIKSNTFNDKKIATQMVSKVIVMLIISCILVGGVSIGIYRNSNIESSKEYATYIVDGVQARIDAWEMQNTLNEDVETPYWKTIKNYLNDVKTNTDVEYLFIAYFEGDDIYYFAEGVKSGDDMENIARFKEKATPGDFNDSYIARIKKGETVSEYSKYEGYGRIIEGKTPIKGSGGKIIGFVGVDINGDDVFMGTLMFIAAIIVVILIVSILFSIVFARNINKFVNKPIMQIANAANQMSIGNIDVMLDTDVRNEIGVLRDAFMSMNESVRQQARILEKASSGDFREHIEIRSEDDIINKSINNLIDANKNSAESILEASKQVARGATEIEAGAQTVAEGANEQAGSIEQFKLMIEDLIRIAKQNSESVRDVTNANDTAMVKLADTADTIDKLANSLNKVSGNAKEISSVMQLIDNIAFQTNILALNAAVEAARAGHHGKGFAVVADEVRELANKSAQAASETEAMLTDSFSLMEEGSQLANSGNESLKNLTHFADVVTQSINAIKEETIKQETAIQETLKRIEEFSDVIQKNSTMSEQSATSATYLSELAHSLEDIMKSYKFNNSEERNI